MDALSTIGYEGAAWDELESALRGCGARLLLDVREAPISRRPAFPKRALEASLAAAGVGYRHERALGAPRALRQQLREGACDNAGFFARYEQHLAGQRALLHALAAELDGHIVLMCYERDWRQCHRAVVADALEGITGLTARHLTPGAG